MALAGCTTLADFRALTPEKLFDAWNQAKKELHSPGCFPCIDGRLVVGSGAELLAQGAQRDIPYMAGSTSEDMMPPILQSMARKWCAAQRQPSYAWYFDRQLPGDDNGAWHSSDLWYWFGTLPNGWRPFTEKDEAVSSQMVGYLCHFARSGDPNGDALPVWQASAPDQRQVLMIGEGETRMGRPSLVKMIHTMLTSKAVGE